MSNATPLSKFDFVFISYDEPNCEENWADLLNKVPWAKRVHGVKGSDAAHKEAARLADTDRFITVDADNIIDENFLNIKIDFESERFKDKVLCWAAINYVNTLTYGNGGLKCWTKEHVMSMKTHEEAPEGSSPGEKIEFCYNGNYVQMGDVYSETFCNASPLQAFRAGFREGVKMTLNCGEKNELFDIKNNMLSFNLKYLMTWASVGSDVENGLWSIYGARLGCKMTNLDNWDYINVRDFEHINEIFDQEITRLKGNETHKCKNTKVTWDNDLLFKESCALKDLINTKLKLGICDLTPEQSVFFKRIQDLYRYDHFTSKYNK